MNIARIAECQVRKNPNWEMMKEGEEFVNVVLETDQGGRIFVDIACADKGSIKIHITPIPEGKVKTHDKTIEISATDGATIQDSLKQHD
ncbi:MAG: hypothetical protein PHI04_06620 [Clostridiaceae bacterium]|nr:hypothetical protein [Clostridiaceae bacterium]